MKYVSIDIETTGLDSEACQILQIGAVIEDTTDLKPLDKLPRFMCILEHETYSGQPTALSMNAWILKILSGMEGLSKDDRIEYRKTNSIIPAGLAAKQLQMWLMANGFKMESTGAVKINAAGKNFATFDKLFLQKLPGWGSCIQMRQRIIDPAILCTDWKEDDSLPNLNMCLKRFDLPGEVTHDACQDALDVIRVIRSATHNYTINNN
jgi:oligoribonuclease